MKNLKTQDIIEILIEELSLVCGLRKEEISIEQGFLELGLESLQAVALLQKVGERLSTKIEVTSIFDHPSILQLAQYLSGEIATTQTLIKSPIHSSASNGPIAVIGMSCRFPKAKNTKEFEANLRNRVNGVQKLGNFRWGESNDRAIDFIGGIDDYDKFAADVFGISETEALRMDPQQRLLLEQTWLAIEDAGYSPHELRGSTTGVFVGVSTADYGRLLAGSHQDIFAATGNALSVAANRLSYYFDLKGPSLAVDTACSSSLVAIHLAVSALNRGEVEIAIVSGVNLVLTPDLSRAFSSATMLSPDGRCASFSSDANGYVRGEGVGVVILKRLKDADSDRVYAIIQSTAVNQDGKSTTLTAPNGTSQEAVMNEALSKAALLPDEISYHEAHGTGTPLGDPVEMLAIERVHQGRQNSLLVGSVKTNIGHLESAAGIAGFIKLALSLYHKTIFPNLHFKELNPELTGKIPSLKVSEFLQPWQVEASRFRVGSVCSFGFGGTNACAILAEAPFKLEKPSRLSNKGATVVGFSANSPAAAEEALNSFKSSIQNLDWDSIRLQADASLHQRMNLPHRIFVSAKSKDELLKKIEQKKFKSFQRTSQVHRVCFLFTGQGSQYTRMYFDFYELSDSFKTRVNSLLIKAQKFFPLNLFEVWTNSKFEAELQQTDYGQILIFVLQLAFAEHVQKEFNIEPEFVFGHSLGEIIAAVFSGILSEEDGISLIAFRGRLMRNTLPGAMTAVFAERSAVDPILQSNARLDYAALNGNQLQVISGGVAEVESFESQLAKKEIRFKRMAVRQAFHSYLMDPILDIFEESIRPFKGNKSSCKFVSSLSGELVSNPETLDSSYWKTQLRNPTQFANGIETLVSQKANVFIEMGPQPVLSGMAQRIVQNPNITWISFFEPRVDGAETYINGVIRGIGQGIFQPKKNFRSFDLQPTCFERRSYFVKGSLQEESKLVPLAKLPSKSEILSDLTQIVSSVMRVDPKEISTSENLLDIGADSLALMNAIQSIKDNYRVSVPVSDVFKNLNTLEKIAEFVAAEVSKTSPQKAQPLSSPVTSVEFESLGKEKLGVLGNFKSFASTDALISEADIKKRKFISGFIADFNQQTPKTKAHVEKFRKVLADNRTSAGFRPETKEMIYPIHCYQAKGSRFTDVDGNEYIDFTMGFGVNLFGHSPDFLQKAMLKQIELGVCVGPQSFLAGEVASLICELTGLERAAFVNSGTEAVMTALRLARSATKREKIVLFDGSYHGHFDGVLARGTKGLNSIPVAAGIPVHMVDDVIVLEYGSEASLKVIRELGNSLAAVLVEPVQSRFPERQPKEFLKQLRQITKDHGTAFIWDEVITGFRIHPGGAQAHFGVQADLAAYGKIVGGGMPIGVVAGDKKYLDFIDGGDWHFGDESAPLKEMTFFAGTFSKHPLAMATAFETLKLLKIEGKELLEKLNKKTQRLCDELNVFFAGRAIDVRLVNFGSLFRFKGNLNLDLFFASLNKKGFYIWEGRNLFLSTAHSDEEIEKFKSAIHEAVDELLAAGFLQRLNSSENYLSLIDPQKRFLKLARKSEMGFSASQICVSAKVKGFLDPEKLKQAFNFLVKERDLFRWHANLEQGTQFFQREKPEIEVEFISLKNQKAPWKILDQELNKMAKARLEIERELPIKVKLFDIVEETHVMAIVCHHLAFDGWTMTLLFEDLASVYNSLLKNEKPMLATTLRYEDFLGTENIWASPQQILESEKFWLTEFAKTPNEQAKNPFNGIVKGISQTEFEGQRLVFDIELKIYEELKRYSKTHKLTPFMFLLGAFAKSVMQKLSLSEIIIGIPAANRDHLGADKMYGNCANLLPIRISNIEDPNEFFETLKQTVVGAYQNMNYPYERLKQKTGQLFSVYFNLEPTSDLPELDQASLIIHPFPIAASEFPLMLNITDFEYYYHCEFDFQSQAMSDDFCLELIGDLKKSIKKILLKPI